MKSIQESNLSIQKQVQREREVFKAKVVANAKQTSKLHRLLSDLIKGDLSDVQALQSKVAVPRDRIHRLTRANGILRQQADLRAMDADTLVLATEGSFPPLSCILLLQQTVPDFSDVSFFTGIASGDINLDLLDLDQSTRDAHTQLQQLGAAAGVSTPLEVNIAKEVHHAKKPGKRRRLRRARSSSKSLPSPSSDSEDSKRRHRKPSGSPKTACCCWARQRSRHRQRSESLETSRSAYAQGLRKTKPAKKRRAASGPIAVPPKDRSTFKATDPRLRDSPTAPATSSSPSPSPIIPSVAAPASGPSLAVTQGPAQALLSTGDSRGARTVSQPAPTDVSIVARRAASPGEGSARRTSSVTGSGTVAGTSVKVSLHLYPSSMFPVPSHAAASSSVPASAHSPDSLSDPSPREPATPSRQSSQRSMFKSSLLAEQESGLDSDVLGLELDVVEVSSGDEGSRSPASPSSVDAEEKTEDVTVDSPVQEVPSSQPSRRVLSLTPGSGPVIRLSSEASPAAGSIPVPSQAPLQTPGDTSAAPLTHSRPGVVIVSTFTPGFGPRSVRHSSACPRCPAHRALVCEAPVVYQPDRRPQVPQESCSTLLVRDHLRACSDADW
ncbi:hypothetical protein PC121_g18723 [Phytophthora cactorum]|nr:hypothetical protein PC120_g18506 [Phytophthora cactorum]KAG3049813.1 hypothetical protein PC121_g18723 [Phytophthora cactorum]